MTTIGQLLAQDPRPLSIVMVDALHTADAAHQHYKIQVDQEGGATPESMGRLLEAAERVIKLGKAAMATGLIQKQTEAIQRDQAQQARVIAQSMVTAIDHLLDNMAEVDVRDRDRYRALAVSAAFAALNGSTLPDLAPRVLVPERIEAGYVHPRPGAPVEVDGRVIEIEGDDQHT